MSPKPPSSWSNSAQAAPAELQGPPKCTPWQNLTVAHVRQVPRLCRKMRSCMQMGIESKNEATVITLPPFCCRDLSAGPARGHFGRPNRFGTAPWSPNKSKLAPSKHPKRPFRSRAVLKSTNYNFSANFIEKSDT